MIDLLDDINIDEIVSGLFTKEQIKIIFENYEGLRNDELANLINDEFGSDFSASQIANFKGRFRLKSGINTRFKKGEEHHNYKPDGNEFLRNGYVYVKVYDEDKKKFIKKSKSSLIYEKHHGKIPDDKIVVFLDGNNRNFDIENLKLIDKGSLVVANREGYKSDDRQVMEAYYNIAELQNAVFKKEREMSERK